MSLSKYLFVGVFVCYVGLMAALADEEKTKKQLEKISSDLIANLPLEKVISLKSLSPEDSGLPEEFLKKLVNDIESALLKASQFEINLLVRSKMEDVWQEAMEFNNAKFEDLYKEANAEIMIMLTPRLVAKGVEINLGAYSVAGDTAGTTLASSGSVLLEMNVKDNLGIDIQDFNKQMDETLAEIERIRKSGGLIDEPTTFAEYYHNAKILKKNGEIDLSLRNFETALSMGQEFVDPLLEFLDIAIAKFGTRSTINYFEKRVAKNLNKNMTDLAYLKLGKIRIGDLYDEEKLYNKEVFLPHLAIWLRMEAPEIIASNIDYNERSYTADLFSLTALRLVINSFYKGELQKQFIDKEFVKDFVTYSDLLAAEKKLNKFEYSVRELEIEKSGAEIIVNQATESYTFGNERRKTLPSNFVELGSDGKFYEKEDDNFTIKTIEGELGARLICPGVSWDTEAPHFWKREGDSTIADFIDKGGFSVSYKDRREPSFNDNEPLRACENQSNTRMNYTQDRLVFASVCKDSGRYSVISDLLITDEVDTSEPIIVRLGISAIDGQLLYYDTDISIDGTYFSKYSAPVGGEIAEGSYIHEKYSNRWLFAPGYVQSTLQWDSRNEKFNSSIPGAWPVEYAVPMIYQISYTDVAGRKKIVKNSMMDQYTVSTHWQDKEDYGFNRYYSVPIVRAKYRLVGGDHEGFCSFPAENIKFVSKGISSKEIARKIETIFKSQSQRNRQIMQNVLKNYGFYKGGVDGKWGKGTEDAFIALLDYIEKYHPEREYVKNFNLDADQFTPQMMISFWNGMFSGNPCEKGLLSKTPVCG